MKKAEPSDERGVADSAFANGRSTAATRLSHPLWLRKGTQIADAIEPRRFRILDALIIVFAIAVALAACRIVAPINYQPGSPAEFVFYARTISLSLSFALCLMVVLEVATLPTAIRSPGKLCLLSIACVAFLDQMLVWDWLIDDDGAFAFFTFALLSSDFREPAYASCAALTCSAALRIPFKGQDWLGASGLLLGVFWIAGALLLPVYYHFAVPWWRGP